MIKQTNKSTSLTSFHGSTIKATVNELNEVLGEPMYVGEEQDKVQNEWEMELVDDDGSVFTVYDWKEYRQYSKNELIEWHIGGMNKRVTEQARIELEQLLVK